MRPRDNLPDDPVLDDIFHESIITDKGVYDLVYEDEPLGNLNPKGCNQHTGPGCAGKEPPVSVTKTQHIHAANVEKEIASAIGGEWEEDNKPYDCRVPNQHAVEVKSVIVGGKTKTHITVNDDALLRKVNYAKQSGETFHTVVVDDRETYNKGENKENYSGHRIYYQRGCGRLLISGMYKCKDMEEVKRLINLPARNLPVAARGSLPSGRKELKALKERAEKEHQRRLGIDRRRREKAKQEKEVKE